MKFLVIDTETTGLFDFSKPADAEGQPRLANLAMIALDESLQEKARWNFYVKPRGWKMAEEAQKINGLTDKFLDDNGVPVKDVLETYVSQITAGYVVTAFGAQYDTKVCRGELRRSGMDDRFETTPNICVMKALTGVCKIPRANGRGYKFPKLSEACHHFHIMQPQAHTALGDALCTVELLRWLKNLNLIPEPEVHYAKERV
jgi:DNA polymerase III epsilon subunit-like protein